MRASLSRLSPGNQDGGTAGARRAPLPTQPGCGHSGAAGGNGGWAPTAVGWAWGGADGNCFQIVFAASFFFLNSEYNFFNF